MNSGGSTPLRSAHHDRIWLSILTIGLALLLTACPGRSSVPLPPQAIRHWATTRDGWKLALTEYKPAKPEGRPVLLVHGISANDRNMDLDAQHSLARWLAEHGRDAWTLSLRGTGDSDQADADQNRPGGYTMDTMAREDLPAAIQFVRDQTHVDSIDYIGHSMGGILIYAYLAEGGQGVNAAVTLGSPTRLDFGSRLEPVVLGTVGTVVSKDGSIPTATPARFLLPLQASFGGPVATIFYNPANVSPATWRRMVAIGIADISGALLIQLSNLVSTGQFTSADGKIDYRHDMASIRTPILVVAGKADRLGSVMSVRDGYRALGGPKEWLLLAEENGVANDYGHMDMVVGDRAPVELWPSVLDFLARHAK